LTLNLAFADGSTQYQLTPSDWGTTIPINVWATVTTSTPISTNNHDGLQFIYLDVLSSVPYGGPSAPGGSTAVDGQLECATSSDLFSANGSQNGEITDANGDGVMDVGPLTSPRTVVPEQQLTLLAKPRSGDPIWDTASEFDPAEVVVNGNSVSFLVETIDFAVNTDTGIETDLDPLIPDISPPYVDANWFEDDPTTPEGSVGVQYIRTAPLSCRYRCRDLRQ
jgi:hypothetical protein